jgi:hypothetical protein
MDIEERAEDRDEEGREKETKRKDLQPNENVKKGQEDKTIMLEITLG